MFTSWKRERVIRHTLRGIARQRVAMVLQPGSVWVIEMALQRNNDSEAALATCIMRGWVVLLYEDLPTGDLTPEGTLPSEAAFLKTETHYRLTEGGWAAINRAHAWVLINVTVAVLAILVAVWIART